MNRVTRERLEFAAIATGITLGLTLMTIDGMSSYIGSAIYLASVVCGVLWIGGVVGLPRKRRLSERGCHCSSCDDTHDQEPGQSLDRR